MKSLGIDIEELAERLDLPEDILLNSLKLSVTGGKRALVENHRGILEYGSDRIVIAAKRGRLKMFGSELKICAMNREALLISGRINSMEWE